MRAHRWSLLGCNLRDGMLRAGRWALPLGLCLLASGMAWAQTDVGLSAYGAFTGLGKTTGISTGFMNPASAMGGMLEVRHIHSPMIGFEASYAVNRANQRFLPTFPAVPVPGPGPVMGNVEDSISAFAHEIDGDWIFSDSVTKSLQIFTVVGAGVQITVPTGNSNNDSSSSTAAYNLGVGLDWQKFEHFGLRAQYRGDIHKAPQFSSAPSSGSILYTSEPMVGLYYRF